MANDIPLQEIEVQLSQIGQDAPIARIVYPDSSHRDFRVRSLSMRGAQREVTGVLIRRGYRPRTRPFTWERTGDTAPTWSRKFGPDRPQDEVLQ
jgi:hypothetical protein